MNPLQTDFYRLRCAGTPWCLILTPDYRECQRSLCKLLAEQDDPPSLWVWDCLQGHRCLSDAAQTSYLGSPDDTVQAPALLLKKALELPANNVLFFIVPKNEVVEDAVVIQGLANLRNEFKANKRTLVLLGRAVKLPSFLSEDVPVLEDPLPTNTEIWCIIEGLVKGERSAARTFSSWPRPTASTRCLPELQHRLNLGIWYFDVPSAQERPPSGRSRRSAWPGTQRPARRRRLGRQRHQQLLPDGLHDEHFPQEGGGVDHPGWTDGAGRHRAAARPGREPGLPRRQPAWRLSAASRKPRRAAN